MMVKAEKRIFGTVELVDVLAPDFRGNISSWSCCLAGEGSSKTKGDNPDKSLYDHSPVMD